MNLRFRRDSRWKRRSAEIDEELQSHLRMAAEDRAERGAAPDEAAAAARRELGNATLIRETTRDQWQFARVRRSIEDLLQDLRFAVRTLRKSPGFALTVIFTLGVGIGLNSAIFSAAMGGLSPELPVKNPSGIAVLMIGKVSQGWNRRLATPAEFSAWRENNGAFSAMAAKKSDSLVLTGRSEPLRISVERVTPNYFQVLGTSPILGRAFTPTEGASKQLLTAIISYDLWQGTFGGDPKILGHTVELSGLVYKIIGVMPARFKYVLSWGADVWTPADLGAQAVAPNQNQDRELLVVARRKGGVTTMRLGAQMATVEANLSREYSDERGWAPEILSLRDYSTSPNTLLSQRILMAIVAIILLIVCANVAGLFLAKCATRTGEFALRAALGAGRERVVRQLLAEALLLGAAGGGIAALVLSALMSRLLWIGGWTRGGILHVNVEIFLFALVFSVAAILFFGLIPAIQSSKIDVHSTLKEGGRTGALSPRHHRLRSAFVAVQIAMAVVLTVGAGTMARMILQEYDAPRGFQPAGVLAMEVSLYGDSYNAPARRSAFFRQVLARFRNLPGVQSAAATQLLPLSEGAAVSFEVNGRPTPAKSERPGAVYSAVSTQYFKVMQIPLLAGRAFSESDRDGNPNVVIVNRALAKQYFGDANPVGKSLRLFYSGTDQAPEPAEIAGVVGDVAVYLDGESEPQIYAPSLQRPVGDMNFVVRTARDSANLAPALREAIWAVDKNQPIGPAATMSEIAAKRGGGDWNFGELLAALTLLALGLASLGIYGVVANLVVQRTREIGLRMALGARKFDIFQLVVDKGLILTGVGLGAGLLAASLLPGLIAKAYHDPLVSGGLLLEIAPAVILLAALLACWIPARRAMRVDPASAMRCE